ncbi:hypothetical protein C8Q76DRAFT_789493 [Earliella scabrosa]|nr:hypothetical protein C8Q76DRAFT_789493 [Earliella scabrosa]
MPTLDNTLGSAYIGVLLSASLLGVTTLQTYMYYDRSKDDSLRLRTLIALLWAADIVHFVFLSQTVYFYAVTNFGNRLALAQPTRTVLGQIAVTGLSDFVLAAALVALGLTIVLTIKSLGCATYFEIDQRYSWLIYSGLATASLSDILISTTLCVLLAKQRQAALTRRLDTTVRTVQLYVVNTGTVTRHVCPPSTSHRVRVRTDRDFVAYSLCSLLTLILYAIGPTTMLYLVGFFILPKLMLNALLAMLNARKSLRDHMDGRGTGHTRQPEGVSLQFLAGPARAPGAEENSADQHRSALMFVDITKDGPVCVQQGIV